MAGKEYSDQAYHISRSFEDMVNSTKEKWRDEQARKFELSYVGKMNKALREIQLPIESVIDLVDNKLNEIRRIANG